MLKADEKLINWLMEDSGLSKYSISKATGIPQMTLSDIATGKTSIDNMTFYTASKLTFYAEEAQKNRKGLTVLYYNDNGQYHKLYEMISDRPMSVDEILDFADLSMERIAEMLDFDDLDFECLTAVKE